MFTLTYKEINDGLFTAALEKLADNPHFVGKTAYNLGKIAQLIQRQLTKSRPSFMELVKQYAVLDEKGKVKTTPEGGYTVSEDKRTEFETECDKFLEQTFEVPFFKVSFPDIDLAMSRTQEEGRKLSAAELTALEPILELAASGPKLASV